MNKKEFKNKLKDLSQSQLKRLIKEIKKKQQAFDAGSVKHEQADWCITQVIMEQGSKELNEFFRIHHA
tara:strand:+ start:151 stop:354 length:204 start_codon:yes stop_codon:yes gene_type:complete